MISAVLLAAGESRRMGDFKQLMDFGGKTFVACSVDNLTASRAGEVIVVTGHRAQDIRLALKDRPVIFAHNPDYRSGMSSSVRRGVEAVSTKSRACLIALSDQPQIGTDIVNRVIGAYEKSHPLIVIPTHESRNGHPVLLDLSLKEEILAMDSAQGLRRVVHAHAKETLRVEVSTDAVLMDFDLPEDYDRIKNG